MADKTVSDWTVADLGAYLRDTGATIRVRLVAVGLTTTGYDVSKEYDVSVASPSGCVLVQSASFVAALEEAIRKHDVVSS